MSKIITIEDLAQMENNPTLKADPKANAYVDMANDWVEHYTGQVFGEIKTKTRQMDFARTLFLEPNIDGIETITINGKSISHQLNKSTGRIRLLANADEYDQVEITYRVGTLATPADLKMATLNLAREMMNKPDNFVASESVGGYSISYKDPAQSQISTIATLSNDMAIFNHYKNWKV